MALPVITYDDQKHKYTLDGDPVPSVTQIIDIQDPKDALPWWGMRVGLAAVVELLQTDGISYPALLTEDPQAMRKGQSALEKTVVAHKLSTNHIRDQRGDEGTVIHDAIQKIGVTNETPSFSDYPEELHGFLQAFAGFWLDQEPEFVEQEIILAHPGLRYAGRTDLLAYRDDELAFWDFKTKTGNRLEAYKAHHYQLRGYIDAHNALEQAILDEGGVNEPRFVERGYVVILHEDGRYLVEPTVCSSEMWETFVTRWYRQQDFDRAFRALRPKKPRNKEAA